MGVPANHWKLGLFVILGFLALVAAIASFGAYQLQREIVVYQTFFDESVQGLEVGAPVKFRGVLIGTVSSIDVGPDRRHVEVQSSLAVKELVRLKLVAAPKRGMPTLLGVPPDLRAQLASAGITGVKFMQIDFFSLENDPAPALPFPVGPNYIPAAVSTMKNLEDAIVTAVDRLPVVTDRMVQVMDRIGRILEGIEGQDLPAQASAMLARADRALATLDVTLRALDASALSKRTQATLVAVDEASAHLSAVLVRMNGDEGLVSSTQHTTDALGEVARGARAVGPELSEALRGVERASDAITRLADALERDPDMLLKGRTKRAER